MFFFFFSCFSFRFSTHHSSAKFKIDKDKFSTYNRWQLTRYEPYEMRFNLYLRIFEITVSIKLQIFFAENELNMNMCQLISLIANIFEWVFYYCHCCYFANNDYHVWNETAIKNNVRMFAIFFFFCSICFSNFAKSKSFMFGQFWSYCKNLLAVRGGTDIVSYHSLKPSNSKIDTTELWCNRWHWINVNFISKSLAIEQPLDVIFSQESNPNIGESHARK